MSAAKLRIIFDYSKKKGEKLGELKKISYDAVEELLERVLGNKGLERGADGREKRIVWRLTGT